MWSTDHRHRGTLRGRASVPLFHLGRNKQREIQLVLRNVEGPKDEVATMTLGLRGLRFSINFQGHGLDMGLDRL